MADPKIQIRRSSVPGKIPTTGQLSLGEIAINTHDGKIFLKKNVSGVESIVSLEASEGELSFSDYKILDDISSSFNGSTTQFTLSSNATNFLNSEITSEARIIISVGGIIQQPNPNQTSGFYISGGTDISTDPVKINFVEAPKLGQVFFGVVCGISPSPPQSFVTKEQSIAYSIVFGV
jgi:hypothetical protein